MSADVPSANVLTEATGRQSVTEALARIADEHPLERGTDLQELFRAVATYSESTAEAEHALRILARAVAASDLDSAAILFDGCALGDHDHRPVGAEGNLRGVGVARRSEEHTSELQSRQYLVC